MDGKPRRRRWVWLPGMPLILFALYCASFAVIVEWRTARYKEDHWMPGGPRELGFTYTDRPCCPLEDWLFEFYSPAYTMSEWTGRESNYVFFSYPEGPCRHELESNPEEKPSRP